MKEYLEIHKKYCSIIKQCTSTSRRFMGISSPTSAHFYASILFTKLCTGSLSIKELSPEPELIGSDAHWDFGSVASLTRSLIECYLVFFYLCIEKCMPEEWDARWKLMNLHDHMSRSKMFKAMGEDIESDELSNNNKDEVVSALKGNSWFKILSEKQQAHFLKGNTAFFKSQDEIVEASGGDISGFRFMYRFLSNNTHSFPMGFYRMADNDRGRGVESKIEIQYTGMCLHWAGEYLSKAKSEFIELFENKVPSDV